MACLVCSEVQSKSLEKKKGHRPTGVKEALNRIYMHFVASRNGSSTTLATRRAPERKPIPTRSHFGYFIPEPLNTSCDTRAIDRVGPNANGRFWCVRRGGVDAVGLLRDAAVVFSVQPFSELVRQPLRLNTQPNAFQPHTHQPSDNARWRRFVAEWTEWVTAAFLEQRAILWPSQSHTQIHFIDVSSPSALMSRDGCERQTDHTDFEKGVDDAFSIIAVFGCHPRLFHIQQSDVVLFPGEYVIFAGHIVHAGGAFDHRCECGASGTRCDPESKLLSLHCVCMGVHSYFRINQNLPRDTGKLTYPPE